MATELTTNPAGEGAAELDSEPSLRDTLDAAFEEHATDETPEPKAGEAAAGEGRVRDDQGRFAAKTPAAAPATTGNAQQVLDQGQQHAPQLTHQNGQPQGNAPAPVTDLKAPASWTPQAREKWAGIDPDIKAEIHRRESEAGRVLQQGASQRQFVDAFERLMQPYEMFIRAENSNPLAAVDNMMRTAAQLRVGTPAAKVDIVAGIIRNFGIDLPMLDQVLAGQQPQGVPQQQQQQQFRDPRVDQLLAMQNHQAQQAQQFEQQSIQQGLQQFAAGHEFYGDVAGIMADLVEIQTRQGQAVDLEKVYQRACQMHDGVSTILTQRATSQNTGTNRAAVLRAKRAAASLKSESTPHGATVPKGDSVRAAIEAAMDSIED